MVFSIFSLRGKWNTFFIRTSSPLYLKVSRGWFAPFQKFPFFKMIRQTYIIYIYICIYIHNIYIYICIYIIYIERKKSKQGCWGHGISLGIEEISCWNSKSRLKKKCNFQGWSNGLTQFYILSMRKALFCLESPRLKVGFLEVIKNKSCWIFMNLGFWPWNFQGVLHNFTGVKKAFSCPEYPRVKWQT